MSIALTAEPPSTAARPSDIITMQNGQAVQAYGLVPIAFSLQ